MKLLIVSHTPHYLRDNIPVGWGPTIREIDFLTRLFDQVVHVAPLHVEDPPDSSLPYTSKRVRFRPVRPAGGDNFLDKISVLRTAVQYVKVIRQEMREVDFIHVRCPAAISFVTLVLLALTASPNYRWVKYAGNWRPQRNDPWTYSLQRWWLQKGLHRGVVTVNGRWSDQPPHIFSFLNPSLTDLEIKQSLSNQKNFAPPYWLLFVGRVETEKGAGRALQIAKMLKEQGVEFVLHLVGDGPEKPYWEEWSREQSIDSCTVFHGWLPRPALADFYSQAHFLILPSSASEGWPKVLSEAMAYGVVPLAGAISSIPQILAETGAGMALPPMDIPTFKNTLLDYVAQPDRWKAASLAGIAAASNFTYDSYLEAVRRMFKETWGISLLPQD